MKQSEEAARQARVERGLRLGRQPAVVTAWLDRFTGGPMRGRSVWSELRRAGVVQGVLACAVAVVLLYLVPAVVADVWSAWPQLSSSQRAALVSVGISFWLLVPMVRVVLRTARRFGAARPVNTQGEALVRRVGAFDDTRERARRQAARVLVARSAGGEVVEARVASGDDDGLLTTVFSSPREFRAGWLLIACAASVIDDGFGPWLDADGDRARRAAKQMVFLDERPDWYPTADAAPLTVDVLVQVARSRAREVLHTNAAALDEVTNQLLEARGQLLPATKTAQLLAEGIV